MQVTIEYPKPLPTPPAIVTIVLNRAEAQELLILLGKVGTLYDLYDKLYSVLDGETEAK
jgi:hypothetical protein